VHVRTRIAPSPTGDPHVGTAYVGLVNYCFAKKHGGDFLLRIEDTDQARSTAESERAIFDALHWCGLAWDEGPDVGGPHAPYRQSERTDLYRDRVERLLRDGKAFRCFCSAERLEEMRIAQRAAQQPPRYDGFCASLSAEDIENRLAAGTPFVVRLRVPSTGTCVFDDMLRGRIEIEWKSVDMQVLMKSDGFPTYHLANVVDDHLMEITHVIRGEEWISSAPKHLLLYEYFCWQPPQLCHLPLLRNPDKSKLSKRKNPTGILYYREKGYLPEALLHFLGMLVDSRNDDSLLALTTTGGLLDTMCERFDVTHVSPGGPVFDLEKLRWLNGQHIRRHTATEFLALLENFGYQWPTGIPESARERIAAIAQPRIETLADFEPLVAFFGDRPRLGKSDLHVPKLEDDQAKVALGAAREQLAKLDDSRWNQAEIGEYLKKASASDGLRFRDVARLYYVAITGSPTSVPLFDAMEILGKTESLLRMRVALDALS
jgi:glutamyl-tRNA synthetase